jgi:hypothetical protein
MTRIKIEAEADDIDSLCNTLYSELRRYDALKRFVEYSIERMEPDLVKSIEKVVRKKIESSRRGSAEPWDSDSIRKYLRKLNPDAKRILELVKQRGRITKTEISKKTGFQPMKITGVIAGMNNMANKMGKAPPVLREEVRLESGRDIEYWLEESFLTSLNATGGDKSVL